MVYMHACKPIPASHNAYMGSHFRIQVSMYVHTELKKRRGGSSRGKAKQSKAKQRRGKAKKKEKEKKGKTEKMLKARRWIGRHLRREDEDEMHQGRVVRPTRVSTLMVSNIASTYKQEPMTKTESAWPASFPSAWRKDGRPSLPWTMRGPGESRTPVWPFGWFPWDEVLPFHGSAGVSFLLSPVRGQFIIRCR